MTRTPSTPARRLALGGAAIALTVLLGACSSDPMSGMDHGSTPMTSSSSPSVSVDATHNAQDVSFAQQMIVHHRGAVAMAALAAAQTSSPDVTALAARISAAQQPEITTMTGWLQAWGVTPAMDPSMTGMDHAADSTTSASEGTGTAPPMRGMMTDAEMAQLAAATGSTFDRLFLQLMTIHHEGAIEMSRTERTTGSNPQAVALATGIESSQTREAAEMRAMLRALGS